MWCRPAGRFAPDRPAGGLAAPGPCPLIGSGGAGRGDVDRGLCMSRAGRAGRSRAAASGADVAGGGTPI